jgi:nucleoid DNA-binding protein
MSKQSLSFLFVALFVVLSVPSMSNAMDMSAALKRMDAIIAEMNALRAEFAALADATTAPVAAPAVLGASSGGVLGDDLKFGSTNEDIRKIQKLLATDASIYPYGVSSGFFGPKTRDAIRSFQARFDLDTVGVVGPSTRALLEVFFAAYPSGTYPDDVLKKAVPAVKAVSADSTVKTKVATSGKLRSVKVTEDDDEFIVKSYRKDGKRNRDFILYPEDGDELIEMIAKKLGVSETDIRALVDLEDLHFEKKESSKKATKSDADDAIEDADKEIDKARDRIKDAEKDGDNVDDADEYYDDARKEYKKARTLRNDKEYTDAIERAQKSEDLAKKAIAKLKGGSSGDIDSIDVTVREDDAKVTVEYENGDDKRFTVEETDEDDIVSEIADKLDISKRDVEKELDLEYGDIREILAQIDSNRTRVTVRFTSGLRLRFAVGEDDEDDIVRAISRKIHASKSAIERDIEFD